MFILCNIFFSNDHYTNVSIITSAKDETVSKNIELLDTKRKVSVSIVYNTQQMLNTLCIVLYL